VWGWDCLYERTLDLPPGPIDKLCPTSLYSSLQQLFLLVQLTTVSVTALPLANVTFEILYGLARRRAVKNRPGPQAVTRSPSCTLVGTGSVSVGLPRGLPSKASGSWAATATLLAHEARCTAISEKRPLLGSADGVALTPAMTWLTFPEHWAPEPRG
jgi:hypothetical protein